MKPFVKTSLFTKAVELISKIEDDKLVKIFTRVLQNLVENTISFNNNEISQLSKVLLISLQDLSTCLEVVKFIFQQSAFYNVKSPILKERLMESGFDESKSDLFVSAWNNYSKTIIDKLKQGTISEKQLESTEWNLNVSLAHGYDLQVKKCAVDYHFNVLNNTTEEVEKIILNFNHEQLLEFYEKLEIIQQQLDSLS